LRRAPILTTALLAAAGVLLCAGTASAQSAEAPNGARSPRLLSWAGRTEPVARPVAVAAARAAPDPAEALSRTPRRPNMVIPHGGFAAASPAPASPGPTPGAAVRRTLTPATAWLQPAAPQPMPVMAERAAAPAPAPAPVPAPPAPTPAPRSPAAYLPDPGGRGQAVPAEMIYGPSPTPTPSAADPADPMAPRRDAPIFHMQQGIPAARPDSQSAAPMPGEQAPAAGLPEVADNRAPAVPQGGRYYSVHRQNGRQPDALQMPAPNYVDALAVTMPETIASQDLAAPEQGPTLIRDAQGRLRPAAAASDGDHQ
jgi:hypothetical protein